MTKDITSAMEAIQRVSYELSRSDWALQTRLLQAFDLLAQTRRELERRAVLALHVGRVALERK